MDRDKKETALEYWKRLEENGYEVVGSKDNGDCSTTFYFKKKTNKEN